MSLTNKDKLLISLYKRHTKKSKKCWNFIRIHHLQNVTLVPVDLFDSLPFLQHFPLNSVYTPDLHLTFYKLERHLYNASMNRELYFLMHKTEEENSKHKHARETYHQLYQSVSSLLSLMDSLANHTKPTWDSNFYYKLPYFRHPEIYPSLHAQSLNNNERLQKSKANNKNQNKFKYKLHKSNSHQSQQDSFSFIDVLSEYQLRISRNRVAMSCTEYSIRDFIANNYFPDKVTSKTLCDFVDLPTQLKSYHALPTLLPCDPSFTKHHPILPFYLFSFSNYDLKHVLETFSFYIKRLKENNSQLLGLISLPTKPFIGYADRLYHFCFLTGRDFPDRFYVQLLKPPNKTSLNNVEVMIDWGFSDHVFDSKTPFLKSFSKYRKEISEFFQIYVDFLVRPKVKLILSKLNLEHILTLCLIQNQNCDYILLHLKHLESNNLSGPKWFFWKLILWIGVVVSLLLDKIVMDWEYFLDDSEDTKLKISRFHDLFRIASFWENRKDLFVSCFSNLGLFYFIRSDLLIVPETSKSVNESPDSVSQ